MTPLGPHVRVVFPQRPVVSLRSKTPETFYLSPFGSRAPFQQTSWRDFPQPQERESLTGRTPEGKPSQPLLCCTANSWLYHAPLGQGCKCISWCEFGLKRQLQDGDTIQIDLIIFNFACRALRAERPLLANDISEWPAWLGRPSKSEFMGSLNFRLRKLKLNPAKRSRLIQDDADDVLALFDRAPAQSLSRGRRNPHLHLRRFPYPSIRPSTQVPERRPARPENLPALMRASEKETCPRNGWYPIDASRPPRRAWRALSALLRPL